MCNIQQKIGRNEIKLTEFQWPATTAMPASISMRSMGDFMLQMIIIAINNRRIITFTYNGIARKVEPHAVGISRTGKKVLRCYQIEGAHIRSGHDWDLCELSKIINFKNTSETFDSARPGYKQGDSHMVTIYAQL